MYSVMCDMGVELNTKVQENNNFKKQLIDANVDLSKLIQIESELKKLNSNMEALAEEKIRDLVTIDDIERKSEIVINTLDGIVTKLKEGMETVETEMVEDSFEVRIFVLFCILFELH